MKFPGFKYKKELAGHTGLPAQKSIYSTHYFYFNEWTPIIIIYIEITNLRILTAPLSVLPNCTAPCTLRGKN
jgi:hypothetical protein